MTKLEAWAVLVCSAIGMYGVIWASFSIGFASHDVVAIWPAAGLSLWMAVRFGYIAFPAIFFGDLAYAFFHLDFGAHFVLISAGNAAAAIIAGQFCRRLHSNCSDFARTQDIVTLLLAGTLLSAVAALIGTTIVAQRFQLPAGVAETIAWRWFFSDLSGVLLLSPVLLTWPGAKFSHLWDSRLWLPGAATLAGIGVLGAMSGSPMIAAIGHYPLLLLTMPLILWLALRQSIHELSLFMTVLLTAMLILTLSRVGHIDDTVFLAAQAYALVIAGTALVVAATAEERRVALCHLNAERLSLEATIAERTKELREQYDEALSNADRMKRLASMDTLTGVLNRYGLDHYGQSELQRAKRYDYPLSVIILDLDHFKAINDEFGHAAGDEALKCTADVMSAGIRDGIDLVTRYGGEEFVILLPHTSAASAMKLAERLRLDLAGHQIPALGSQTITASFGVAQVRADAEDLGEAVSEADDALYRAKSMGRNCVVVSELAMAGQ